MLCEHGYTANFDCPICPCPCGSGKPCGECACVPEPEPNFHAITQEHCYPLCPTTARKYRETLESFGPEFERAGHATSDRYRYADSLAHFGFLERRVTQLKDASGRLRGSRTEFRRTPSPGLHQVLGPTPALDEEVYVNDLDGLKEKDMLA